MNGLRMFIRPSQKGQIDHNTFYSQRGDGPVYRWHYEERLARWQVVRLHASQWSSHELCTARWQSVPQKPKTQLSEHYVE
jgi:hypothetical protein